MAGERRWRGRAAIGPRWLAYAGATGPTALHRHHAFQIVRVIDGAVSFGDGRRRTARGSLAVIPPDVAHVLCGKAAMALLVFLDADDLVGRRLQGLAIGDAAEAWTRAATPLSRLQPLTSALRRSDGQADWQPDWQALVDEMTVRLVGEAVPLRTLHPAVERLLPLIEKRLDEDVHVGSLAAMVHLSAGRLGHVFTESVGIPLRPYVLWLRLRRAAASFRDGATLTEAAHDAGFSDSAHLSNAFRRMFGLAPSEVTRGIQWAAAAEPGLRR